MRRVMVVDDDASIRETLTTHFRSAGAEVRGAGSAEQALAAIARFAPDLVITDVRMPGMDGLTLLATIRERVPGADVVVITAFEDMRSAITAMKAGAYEYLVKPLDLDEIDIVVERCFRDRALRHRLDLLAADAAEPYAVDQLVGRDARMIEIYKHVGTLARSRVPVLIRGETGTGKEMIARAIHFNSADASEPFIAVNCTAIPEGLLESELFGHLRGSFTGAVADRRGRFEMAGRGTIFLDEIGDTPPVFQVKLLRVLQECEYYPVGTEQPRRTDARVIAATHRPLEEAVRQGEFREDLYFRLRVVELTVPPLRERRGDIESLARHLLAKSAKAMHRTAHLSQDAIRALERYDWPGNVRELENTLIRALALATGTLITEDDLRIGSQAKASASDATEPATRDLRLTAAEHEHVERVLRECDWNKRRACRALGVSRPRLDRLLEKHGIVVVEGGNET